MNRVRQRRRLLAPEVVQTSAMDCGPAVLQSLLGGHGVTASYARLREACQTDVDGTSINTLEEVARDLGFDARQVLVSPERLEEPRDLAPAIVVVRLPNDVNHFVLLWRARGGWVQVMDPAVGRRWMRAGAFRASAYEHTMEVPAEEWRGWAGSPAFLGPLKERLRRLGLETDEVSRRVDGALAEGTWRGIATLDAAARMTRSLVSSGALRRGDAAARLLGGLADRALAEDLLASTAIPPSYWEVRPCAPGPDGSVRLRVRGAVMVRIQGAARPAAARAEEEEEEEPRKRPPELEAALRAPRARPGRELLRVLRADGRLAPAALLAALGVAATVVMVQALLFRGLLDLQVELALPEQRYFAVALLVGFLATTALFELPVASALFRMGRRIEGRLRAALQTKLPRIADRAFRSIPCSDMAERAHSLLLLRGVAPLGGRIARTAFQLALTAAGLAWLAPSLAPAAGGAALLAVAFPLAFQRALGERELRVRSHRGALARFYLEALLGVVPARTHGAARAMRREHEGLLTEWSRAGRRLLRAGVLVEGLQAVLGFGLAAWLVTAYLAGRGEASGVLLFAYWALGLPALGEELARLALQYPGQRNATARALEPLGAAEDTAPPTPEETADGELPARGIGHLAAAGPAGALAPAMPVGPTPPAVVSRGAGVGLRFRDVTVRAGGHAILTGVQLEIAPGEHVAIVGPSGAGKSTLVGMLLGWHRPAEGTVEVDGRALDPAELAKLRRRTAWVDPAAQLWNRTLLENVRYGSSTPAGARLDRIGAALSAASLGETLGHLPDGLQTPLGEGGGLLSGGEGQRVRLARAFLRDDVRLAILDEPFRGVDRARRRELLSRARTRWRDATLLCVSHDLAETLDFDRVLVVDAGRIVETGKPAALARRHGSRYGALLAEERAVHAELWNAPFWRRFHMDGGRLREEDPT